MRQIDMMDDEQIEELRVKGMLATSNMYLPEALKLDPEDSGYQDEAKPNKASPGGTVGSGKGYQRKTRDVYMLLDDTGANGMNPTGEWYDNWPQMREALENKRKAYPENRYSYRKRRIKLKVNQ